MNCALILKRFLPLTPYFGKKAIKTEFDSILKNQTWELVDLPSRASNFESLGVRNFRFVIRVLRFMFVLFCVGLDQVCLGCHLFRFGCLLFFVVCIFYDDVSDQIN